MIKKFEDFVSGGTADNKSLSDIAKLHGVDVTDLEKQLAIGIGVEMEHTSNKEIAKEIARDHLVEDPFYYTASKPENWGEKELEDEK